MGANDPGGMMHDDSTNAAAGEDGRGSSEPARPDILRKIRHDMLNTIGVIKLELHVARKHSNERGAEAIDSVQEEVCRLQAQIDELCELCKSLRTRHDPD